MLKCTLNCKSTTDTEGESFLLDLLRSFKFYRRKLIKMSARHIKWSPLKELLSSKTYSWNAFPGVSIVYLLRRPVWNKEGGYDL